MRYPAAVWRRCPGAEPTIRPTQVIFHTMVMRSVIACENYFCGGGSGGIESHFGVGGNWAPNEDGMVRQWRDTQEQGDANYHANLRPDGTGAISIETADNAPPRAADIELWTPKQVDSMVRLGRWLRVAHGIPARICRTPSDPGFGWHVMFGAPGEWTPVAKECPGPRRIAQLKSVVLPRIFADVDPGEEDFDMTPQEAQGAFERALDSKKDELALAISERIPTGMIFVRAENDSRGVFAVTPLGLIHLDDPTHWARVAGRKNIVETALVVHPDWITANLANENVGSTPS